MSRMKRTLSALFYKVDQVVGEIENHDAVITQAIAEQQKMLAKARIEYRRLQSQRTKAEDDILALREKTKTWKDRALGVGEDEDTAVACVAQMERLEAQVEQRQRMVAEFQQAQVRMNEDIQRAEAQLRDLKQKHQLLRARQTTADALGSLGDLGQTRGHDLQDSFDRWEVRISQHEVLTDVELGIDDEALDRQFRKEEDRAKLKSRLQDLKHGGIKKNEEKNDD